MIEKNRKEQSLIAAATTGIEFAHLAIALLELGHAGIGTYDIVFSPTHGIAN